MADSFLSCMHVHEGGQEVAQTREGGGQASSAAAEAAKEGKAKEEDNEKQWEISDGGSIESVFSLQPGDIQ